MPKIDLLPCPFCGSITAPTVMNQNEAQWLDNDIDEEDLSMVVCCATRKHGCGASTGFCDTAEQAVKEWNTRASGWISCSERMPDPHAKVLFATFGKSVWCGKYCGIRNGRKTWETSKFVSTFWDDEVTHWMPVPDAPAKEKPPQNAGR